jgi:hypothetical protein
VLACGRRWGKTRFGVLLCTYVAMMPGQRHAWWVAPSYKMGQVGWRGAMELASQIPGASILRGEMMITMPGCGWLQVRSADNPQSLRGEGLDQVVLDECAYIQEEAWAEAIRPALSDRRGGATFISTPKGRNWFWRLFQQGLSGDDPEWRAWRRPTSDNPYIDASEIEAARKGLPERIFAQEYLAEFLEDAGYVFRRVAEAATATEQLPQPGGEYVFGVDGGKSADFTVISVIDIAAMRMVAMDRFNQIDYVVQSARLKALAERYAPRVILAESNSMGEPIIERLQRDGLPVRGFTTTNATKAQVIEGLALAFERRDLAILNEPVLVGELQAFDMTRLPSGMVRYSAPEGMHDDCVMSLALAYSAAEVPTGASLIAAW